jgi:hypothetical protein
MPRTRKKATGFLLPLPASRWTLSSVIVGVLVLLSYEAVHEFAFPVIVHDASHTTIQACFTPGMGCQKRLIRILDAAKEEILVETYSFTATPLMEALVRAKKRGVSVSVIADHGQQTAPYSKIPDLQKAGIPVLYDHSVAIAHNKVMIIRQSSQALTTSLTPPSTKTQKTCSSSKTAPLSVSTEKTGSQDKALPQHHSRKDKKMSEIRIEKLRTRGHFLTTLSFH